MNDNEIRLQLAVTLIALTVGVIAGMAWGLLR